MSGTMATSHKHCHSVLLIASFCGTYLQNSILRVLKPDYLRMCFLYIKAEAGSWGCATLWEHSLVKKKKT